MAGRIPILACIPSVCRVNDSSQMKSSTRSGDRQGIGWVKANNVGRLAHGVSLSQSGSRGLDVPLNLNQHRPLSATAPAKLIDSHYWLNPLLDLIRHGRTPFSPKGASGRMDRVHQLRPRPETEVCC